MKSILGSRKAQSLVRLGLFLIALVLIAGMAGCPGGYNPPPRNPEIRTWYDLDNIRNYLAADYALMNDLDSTTPGYEELAGPNGNEGQGWLPIGADELYAFTGRLDGQGYEIRDLFMYASGASQVGVFGFVGGGGRIEDIGVVNAVVVSPSVAGGLAGVCYGTVTNSYSIATVYGHECAGGLVGICNGAVTNSYSTGNVSGEGVAGGLVGWSKDWGTASNSYSTGNVTGNHAVGGLVGRNQGTVSNSYAMGTVTCSGAVAGGLVGINDGTVTKSHSTGSVTGDQEVGGLVGINGWYSEWYSNPGTVINSYSTGSVAGRYDVGGLVGANGYDSIVTDSYATGNVSGDDCAGGLVGTNVGSVEDSYSAGNVTGNSKVGGLVGDDGSTGTVIDSFWDIETSGQSTSDGGTGKNTTQMQDIVTFSGAGWNIIEVGLNETNPAYIWNIVNNVTYPFLSWQAV